MTEHALARLAERVPGCDPVALLSRIRVADSRGELVEIAHSLTDRCRITGYAVPNGPYVFPIIAADSGIITVLGEGMETETVTGRVTLARPVKQRLTPGIHQISADAYHADNLAPEPSLSSTLARLLLNQSPLHAWTASPRLNPDWQPVEKKTFDIGRAAHRAVLGAGSDFCVIPEDILASNGAASTKEAKAFVEAARADGLTPLKHGEIDEIQAIASAVQRKLLLAKINIEPSRSEMAAIAQIDGIWCRAMIDNAPENSPYLIDLKTTTDASPEACIRAVTNYSYDVQAAHYQAVWEAATGEKRRMLFVFVEKEPPYEVGFVQLYGKVGDEADWMDDANGKAAESRRVWSECLTSGYWPGYPAQIATVGAPGYYRAKWDNYNVAPQPIKKPMAETLRMATAMQAPERKSS